MTDPAGSKPRKYLLYAATVIATVVSSFLCTSCNRNGKQLGKAVTNRDSVSVMSTRGVDMLISENGIVRYHVITESWDIYDKMKRPFYSMEEGILLEILDSAMQVESSIIADTAYYYMNEELWELRRNVHAENVRNEKFDTHLLFVNNRTNRMYSDSLIRIDQENQTIIGRGFESNNNLTEYTIRQTEGVFPVSDEE